jgi:hypothetical protein
LVTFFQKESCALALLVRQGKRSSGAALLNYTIPQESIPSDKAQASPAKRVQRRQFMQKSIFATFCANRK